MNEFEDSEAILFGDSGELDYERNAKAKRKRTSRKRKKTVRKATRKVPLVSIPAPVPVSTPLKKRRKTSKRTPAKKTTRRRKSIARRSGRSIVLPTGNLNVKNWRKFELNKGRRRGYQKNPETKPGNIFSLPKWDQIKSQPIRSIGFGGLGLLDTSIVGMVIDFGLSKAQQFPEPGRDVARILGKFTAGTALSFAIGKITKNQNDSRVHQVGVYISTILDGIGTTIKYAQRSMGGTRYKITGNGYSGPMTLSTPSRVIASVMGFGSIVGALEESKLADALAADGLVVAKGENGMVALAAANTGEIIVSGPESAMKGVVESAKNFKILTGEGSLGEDISIES